MNNTQEKSKPLSNTLLVNVLELCDDEKYIPNRMIVKSLIKEFLEIKDFFALCNKKE